jgi:hypothetical protein
MQQPAENRYLDVALSALTCLGDTVLSEDADLVCKYLVLRFLKTLAPGEDPSVPALQEYIKDVFPVLLTFLSMANAQLILKTTHVHSGGLVQDE